MESQVLFVNFIKLFFISSRLKNEGLNYRKFLLLGGKIFSKYVGKRIIKNLK